MRPPDDPHGLVFAWMPPSVSLRWLPPPLSRSPPRRRAARPSVALGGREPGRPKPTKSPSPSTPAAAVQGRGGWPPTWQRRCTDCPLRRGVEADSGVTSRTRLRVPQRAVLGWICTSQMVKKTGRGHRRNGRTRKSRSRADHRRGINIRMGSTAVCLASQNARSRNNPVTESEGRIRSHTSSAHGRIASWTPTMS